jgi:hypothetical protein
MGFNEAKDKGKASGWYSLLYKKPPPVQRFLHFVPGTHITPDYILCVARSPYFNFLLQTGYSYGVL